MVTEVEFIQKIKKERLIKFIEKEEKSHWLSSIFYPAKAAVEASKIHLRAMERFEHGN